ncbi:MAG: TatD family hydrolase [Cystobacterineae bacterium]|nr:TatD family hydrolase [Cystobacterineae bacterium]
MFDSHCHLDSTLFQEPFPLLLQRAHQAGICGFLVPAILPEQWEKLSTWPKLYPSCCIALGMHPSALEGRETKEKHDLLERLETLLPKACAVGECGLDKKLGKVVALEKQVEWFSAQLLLAKKHALPLVIHCQGAYGILLELLKQYAPLPAGFVLHSFSGSAQSIAAFAQLGGYFSYSGNICRPNARKALLALHKTPLERLLFETDAPFQTPFPLHGQTNEPAFLKTIVHKASSLLGIPPEKLADLSFLNAQRLFSLPHPP